MPEKDRIALASTVRKRLLQLGWIGHRFSITVTDGPERTQILVTLDTQNEDKSTYYDLIMLPEETAGQLANRFDSLARLEQTDLPIEGKPALERILNEEPF